jgi:hypothetical protein
MRYQYHSWNDVDRTLEAFRYARRSLLVVLALSIPFAAWEAAAPAATALQPTVELRKLSVEPAAETRWPTTVKMCEAVAEFPGFLEFTV